MISTRIRPSTTRQTTAPAAKTEGAGGTSPTLAGSVPSGAVLSGAVLSGASLSGARAACAWPRCP
ncbi:pentapeptide repeat-containing protein [Clavibacter sp. MX14-G9D]|uniref:pentapeptide repeat-containing protein n=1 Tax=Clavibacter sp. MX14-G9D TaxID=3064656 RepID=UPI0037C10869